jgi:hypothetical protein
MKARFEIEATGHLRGFFSGWEFLKETDGIRIYQKTNKANKLRSFKGIGFIDKPHNEVRTALLILPLFDRTLPAD